MSPPELTTSGARLKVIDEQIMLLLRRRMTIAREVAANKQLTGDPIFRGSIEDTRIAEVEDIALREGLNPHFARSMLYNIIGESCKEQMILMQSGETNHLLPECPEERYQVLKSNLIELTRNVAPKYDRSGGADYPGTAAYVDYENDQINKQVGLIPKSDRRTAIDLGCAVGRVSRMLASSFDRVIGFDLSQHMISEAWTRNDRLDSPFENLDFIQQDLEEGIPLDDQSVDLVVMNLGTASDMRDIRGVFGEVGRVLRPEGRFLFSFYNAEALIYLPEYVSIGSGLAAEINADENCLTVHVPGHQDDETDEYVPGKDYMVFARPYTWGEIETLIGSPLKVEGYLTHPVLASIVPGAVLKNNQISSTIATLDRGNLEYSGSGAYHVVSGKRFY